MSFGIIPPENLWWLYAILIASAFAMVFAYVSISRQSKQPGQEKRWVLKLRFILPLMAIMGLVGCWTVYKQATATLEISDDTLKIHAGLYSQEILKSDLRLNEAKIIKLSESRQLQPISRTNGTGAPGFGAGWFVLRNGEKAFLLVADADNILYIPSREFALLVSLVNPEGFLANLKK